MIGKRTKNINRILCCFRFYFLTIMSAITFYLLMKVSDKNVFHLLLWLLSLVLVYLSFWGYTRLIEREREWLKAVINQSEDVIIMSDENRNVLYANQLARSFQHFLIKDEKIVEKVMANEVLHFSFNGHTYSFQFKQMHVGQNMITIGRDVSKLKVAEAKFSLLAENFSEEVILTNKEGEIIDVNQLFLDGSGYQKGELLGRSGGIFQGALKSQQTYKELSSLINPNGKWSGEVWDTHKSGEMQKKWLTFQKVAQEEGDELFLFIFKDLVDKTETKKEFLLAQDVQRSFLPGEIEHQLFTVKSIYQPHHYISGDLYFFEYDEKKCLLRGYIVDVMGHGLSTAVQVSAIRILFNQVQAMNFSLTEKFIWINEQVLEYFAEDMFAAAFYFEFDFNKMELSYINAGINYYLTSIHEHDPITRIKGTFLGIFKDAIFTEKRLKFQSGDVFIFLTDGLYDILPELFSINPEGFEEMVLDLLYLARGKDRDDDITALCIKIN